MTFLILAIVLFSAKCFLTWMVFGLVLYLDQEVTMNKFRKYMQKRLFREALFWPLTVSPFRWPKLILIALVILVYPLIYLFRTQRFGCFARPPQEPQPWLNGPSKKEEGSCSKSNLETALCQYDGAWTTPVR